jgi:hypothetical protein
MNVVFVAGPYRHTDEWRVFQNIRRAETLALSLWSMGLAVICPHKNTEHFGGAAPDAVWLDGALEMVRRSDAVVCLPDWEESEGACGEVALAKQMGIPVFYSLGEVETWAISLEQEQYRSLKKSG